MLQNKNSLCFFFCLIFFFFFKTSIPQARKTSDECKNEELPEAWVQALMSVQKPGVSQRPEEEDKTWIRSTSSVKLPTQGATLHLKSFTTHLSGLYSESGYLSV